MNAGGRQARAGYSPTCTQRREFRAADAGIVPAAIGRHPSDRIAVIHGERRFSYRQFYERARRLASALARRGVRAGDTVSVMLPNVPAMLEAHYGVPMLGAVLNTINTRLDAATIAYILEHGEAKVLITDREFAAQVGPALAQLKKKRRWSSTSTTRSIPGRASGSARSNTRTFIAKGDPDFEWTPPADESSAIALNYTSGTTGNPKGVVYHHRGTFLESVGNIMAWPLPPQPVYLWTLPMFHCNGWCFPWSVTAMGGTHVCLRKVDPALIFPLIVEHGVTHMCGAPTVLNMLIKRAGRAAARVRPGRRYPDRRLAAARQGDQGDGGARLPRHAHLRHDRAAGPSTLCVPQDGWEALPLEERAALSHARACAIRWSTARWWPTRRRSSRCRATARPSARSWCAATP